MIVELELPDLLAELADAHHVDPPPPLELSRAPSLDDQPAGRSWLAVAGVAAGGIGLITGLTVLATYRDGGSAPADQPARPTETTVPTTSPVETREGAVVLAPPPDSGITLQAVRPLDLSHAAGGAVVAPDGTVFGIGVGPGDGTWLPDDDMWTRIPADQRDVAVVAGFEVAAFVDASAPTQIRRTLRHPCLAVNVPTAGEPMWSDDFSTLLAATTIDDTGITVDLPSGWRSLGGMGVLTGWMLDLEVEIDGSEHSVNLVQVPNAPVGYVLSGTETNPQTIDHRGAEWWVVEIATTPGLTEVAGLSGAGAVRASSDLTADQLLALVDSLLLTSVDRLEELLRPPPGQPDEQFDIATQVSIPDECGLPDIGIDIREP